VGFGLNREDGKGEWGALTKRFHHSIYNSGEKVPYSLLYSSGRPILIESLRIERMLIAFSKPVGIG